MTQKRNDMTVIEWIYGIKEHDWANMSYSDVITEKYTLGKALRHELVHGPEWYRTEGYSISSRISDVDDAISYNQARLKELE